MNTHRNHTNTSRPVVPVPLAGTWGLRLPRHVEQALEKAPAIVRGFPDQYTYLVGDLAKIYPVRDDADPASGDLFDAAVMYLLEAAGDLACDCGNFDERVPDLVVDWLYAHGDAEMTAWLAMLEAEVRMHQAGILLGQIPRPHSPASYMALRILLADAAVFLDVLYNADEIVLLADFERLGGNARYGNVLDLIRDLVLASPIARDLFGRRDTLPPVTSPLHPANWFLSFEPAQNPWLERAV